VAGNPNLNRILQGALYKLKLEYGTEIQVYKLDAASTNYETGVKTATKSVQTVRKAVVLPASSVRKIFQGISYLSVSKPFASQGGQGWDGTSRAFIVEGRDLPGYEWEVEDWIVYRDKRYDISDIEELEFNSGWMVIGKLVKGQVPERIINVNVVETMNITDEESETKV
jgi:hypothetical protein